MSMYEDLIIHPTIIAAIKKINNNFFTSIDVIKLILAITSAYQSLTTDKIDNQMVESVYIYLVDKYKFIDFNVNTLNRLSILQEELKLKLKLEKEQEQDIWLNE